MRVCSLSWEDSLEEGMATHSSILAGESPWTEELEGLQPMGWQRVGHDYQLSTQHTRPAAVVLLSRTPPAEQPLRGCPKCCLPVNRAPLCPARLAAPFQLHSPSFR